MINYRNLLKSTNQQKVDFLKHIEYQYNTENTRQLSPGKWIKGMMNFIEKEMQMALSSIYKRYSNSLITKEIQIMRYIFHLLHW